MIKVEPKTEVIGYTIHCPETECKTYISLERLRNLRMGVECETGIVPWDKNEILNILTDGLEIKDPADIAEIEKVFGPMINSGIHEDILKKAEAEKAKTAETKLAEAKRAEATAKRKKVKEAQALLIKEQSFAKMRNDEIKRELDRVEKIAKQAEEEANKAELIAGQ